MTSTAQFCSSLSRLDVDRFYGIELGEMFQILTAHDRRMIEATGFLRRDR